MWKWIAVTAAVVVFWAVALLLEMPLWLPTVLTAVVVVVIGVFVALRSLRARKAARELERALSAQAASASDQMRPDLAAEIEDMQAEFHKAIAALKSSSLQGGGTRALYALPWYLMIGPPGSGKTTAIRNSGLQFPYLSGRRGGSVRGIGGTRNCDWWLSNEAVLLDTAGRWTTQDDEGEWFAFLDLLKKHRHRQPLNGIFVSISIDDVVGSGDESATELARRVRERVDEVITRLGVKVPVYVLFTKCDLLPGFVESFGGLAASERGRIWGFTVPYTSGDEQDATDRFTELFDELRTQLDRRLLRRIAEERTAEQRQLTFEFPRQFAAVRNALACFVGELFQPNVFADTPALRGAYFTSGTQEGSPIDRLVHRMAQSFGTGSTLPAEPPAEPKSYFLRDVFGCVAFADHELAAPTRAYERKRRVMHWGVAAAMWGVAAATVMASLSTWSTSRGFLESTGAMLLKPGGGSSRPTARSLASLGDRVRELHAHAQRGAPWSMGMWMYRGDAIREQATARYLALLREHLVAPRVERDRTALLALGRRFAGRPNDRPDTDEHREHYTRLKRYLHLTAPKAHHEPQLGDDGRSWLAQTLASGRGGRQLDRHQRQQLEEHTRFFVEHLDAHEALYFERDEDAVRLARNALRRVTPTRAALEQVIDEVEGHGYELTLRRLVGSTGSALRAERNVRGAFTRKGWERHVRSGLEEQVQRAAGEPWVLGVGTGDGSDAHQRRALAQLRDEYFRAYIEEWRRFIHGIEVRQAENDVEALALLQDLTRGTPAPLARLLQRIARQVHLPAADQQDEADADGLVDVARAEAEQKAAAGRDEELAAVAEGMGAGGPGDEGGREADRLRRADVASAFEGLTRFGAAGEADAEQRTGSSPAAGVDLYQEQLGFLRDALQTYRDDPGDEAALLSRLQEARTRIEGLIEEQPVGWRPRLEAWLWPAVDGASAGSAKSFAAETGRAWCHEVVSAFQRSLAGRYPFEADGPDVALADFAAFFSPERGTLWSFYDEALSEMVLRNGRSFEFGKRLGRDAGELYRNSLPAFLERAQRLGDAFFASDAEAPKAELDVRVRPSPEVASIRLEVGGTTIEYYNGPEQWRRMSWPGDDPAAGALLEVVGAAGTRERLRHDGEWGLFRLLEQGQLSGSSGSRVLRASWRMRGQGTDVVIELRPVRGKSPLRLVGRGRRGPRLFAPLRSAAAQVPRHIAVDVAECDERS